jgi:hypothetical protein
MDGYRKEVSIMPVIPGAYRLLANLIALNKHKGF